MNLTEYSDNYIKRFKELLSSINQSEVELLVEKIRTTTLAGGRVFFMGNGGSASTASHFANDLVTCRINNNPVRALSLTENSSIITAISNDFGYENIFSYQLERDCRKEDLVIAISVSGTSKNVVKGIEYAASNEISNFSILGSNGGELKRISQGYLLINSEKSEFGPVEDIHLMVNHLVSNFLKYEMNK